MRRLFAFADARSQRRAAFDLDALGGAALGVNLYYQGKLLDPRLILNTYATPQQQGGGDTTSDYITEGRDNLFFTVERAQDAAAALFVDSDGITWTYDDINNTLTAELTETGVTPGDYTNANITVGADGRITAAENGDAGTSGPTRVSATFSRPLGLIVTGDYATIDSMPACTILGWRISAKASASIQVDVRVCDWPARPNSGNSITGGNYIALSGASAAQATSVPGWSPTIAEGKRLEFYVVSSSQSDVSIQLIIEPSE